MALWGKNTSDESKPKNLTTAQKQEVYANNLGWVQEAGTVASGNGNANATPEVLVALGGLATALGQATIDAVSFDVGQTISGAGGSDAGLFTKESYDVYGIQAAYNTDSLGVSLSYALTETSTTADTTFFGVNAYYSLDGGPSLSVGFESEDPDASAEETGYFVGLTWDDFGPGSFSIGMSTLENYTDAETELYQYEAAYSYAVNDGMTITPGIFIKETSSDDETGVILKTSFSF